MMCEWLSEILMADKPDTALLVLAAESALSDTLRAKAFNITPTNVSEVIQTRLLLLKAVMPDFQTQCEKCWGIETQSMLKVLWDLWLPLGIKIASHRKSLSRPFIQGILGMQGTGKTTMSRILSLILQKLGYRTLCLSLDDLYKTYSDRLVLTQQDPRLIWRGPPGTHDIHLGLIIFDQVLQNKGPVNIPRFDKSAHGGAGDRTTPLVMADIDIILFEGWFVGVRPIEAKMFTHAPPPIITDQDRQFALDMNSQLSNYLPLWEKLDSLIVLDPIDYRFSLAWRQQAERQMIATFKSGMSDSDVVEFVNYFWRSLHPELFIKPLVKSTAVDLVIEINGDRSLGRVYNNT